MLLLKTVFLYKYLQRKITATIGIMEFALLFLIIIAIFGHLTRMVIK